MKVSPSALLSVFAGSGKKTPVTAVTPVTGISVTGYKSLKLHGLQGLQVENSQKGKRVLEPVTLPVTRPPENEGAGQTRFDQAFYELALAKLESAACLEKGQILPREYVEAWARFQATAWPDVDVPAHDNLISWAGVFLDQWAGVALANEWTAKDLFARPYGLLWRLQGRKIESLGQRCFRLEGNAGLTEWRGAE